MYSNQNNCVSYLISIKCKDMQYICITDENVQFKINWVLQFCKESLLIIDGEYDTEVKNLEVNISNDVNIIKSFYNLVSFYNFPKRDLLLRSLLAKYDYCQSFQSRIVKVIKENNNLESNG